MIVNDRSMHNTRTILNDIEDTYKGMVNIIYHEKKQGKTAALRTDYSAASGNKL